MDEKLHKLTDLRAQLTDKATQHARGRIEGAIEGTRGSKALFLVKRLEQDYQTLQQLYTDCLASAQIARKRAFIFHGTEGDPQENWFPWLKQELEHHGYRVWVLQFPSPPKVPAKIAEWFEVLKDYQQYINKDTVFIGHSLGGIFTLRLLEQLKHPVKAAFLVGTPIGVRPILNYDRDKAFSSFGFDWELIKKKAAHFAVFQSDNDPYVALGNGQALAKHLNTELDFVPQAGHFNSRAGYLKFEKLRDKVLRV